jgi:hypothetical protein
MKLLQIALSVSLVLLPMACASTQDITSEEHKTISEEHKADPDINKITSDTIRFFRYFSVGQLVGVCGNIEKKSANFKVKLPEGFKETLTKLEANYNDEWTAFDQNTDCCIIYYGWIRGNVIGEYKLRLCETHQIDLISLNRHGIGGMGFSRLVDTNKTDKKTSSSYDWFKLPLKAKDIYMGPFSFMKDKRFIFQDGRFRFPLKGRDKWGPFDVDTVGEIFGTGGYGEFFSTGKFMVGSWDTDHGVCGNYKGTFYGIRLDSVKTSSASITNQRLYQTMLNFNP